MCGVNGDVASEQARLSTGSAHARATLALLFLLMLVLVVISMVISMVM